MFFVCILDVSPAMQQQTSLGLTLLECAKSAVEQLLSSRRLESAGQRGDQCHLLICSSTPLPSATPALCAVAASASTLFPQHCHVLCGWHDTSQKFVSALKSLQPPAPPPSSPSPSSTSSFNHLSVSLTCALDVLNKYSRPNGIDNFGKGRIPWYNEPAVVLLFTTDHTPLPPTSPSSPSSPSTPPPPLSSPSPPPFEWPASSTLGSQFASTPYRWDQRIFPCILRLPLRPPPLPSPHPRSSFQSASASGLGVGGGAGGGGGRSAQPPQQPPSPLSRYLQTPAEQTGGKLFIAPSLRLLLSHIDSIATRNHPSFLLHLHPSQLPSSETPALPLTSPSTPPPPFPTADYVGVTVKGVGTWPIPETFASTAAMAVLPPRPPHPTLFYSQRVSPLPSLLTDAPAPAAATTPSFSSPSSSSSLSRLPPLQSSLPYDIYPLEPHPRLTPLLTSDPPHTCRWVSMSEAGTHPFGVVTAWAGGKGGAGSRAAGEGGAEGSPRGGKAGKAGKVALVLLPYDFPTLFILLSRIDLHLRSLPLTSSSTAALHSSPSLYRELAAFLARCPAYAAAPLHAWMAKQPRLPKVEAGGSGVRVGGGAGGGEVGVLGAEVVELMKGWKERAKAMMAVEKEAADKAALEQVDRDWEASMSLPLRNSPLSTPSPSLPHPSHPSTPLTSNRSRKRRRTHRRTPVQSEVEALITGPRTTPALLLPPATEGEQVGEGREEGAGLDSVFLLSEAALDSRLDEWKARVWEAVDTVPLLSRSFPCPRRPPPPATLTLHPRSQAVVAADRAHTRPLATLSDYQSVLRRRQTLRSVEEGMGGGVEGGGFGSPWRRKAGMEEEAVEEKDVVGEGRRGEAEGAKGRGKRTAGKDRLADFVAELARRRERSEVPPAAERASLMHVRDEEEEAGGVEGEGSEGLSSGDDGVVSEVDAESVEMSDASV